jgi:hypothetical protein
MKKFLIFLLLFLNIPLSNAINWDYIVNEYIEISSSDTETFIIPDWYDLFIKTAIIIVDNWGWGDLSSLIEITDWGITSFKWTYPEGESLWEYNLVFTDDITINNLWTLDISVLFTWYFFTEWSVIDINSNELISENGSRTPEYEFLRQNELYSFYVMELTFLLFFSILVILRKYSFQRKYTLSSFK